MYKTIILLIFFSLINKNAFSENKFYIVAKVNNEIITNYDVETESNYLKLLNPNLNQLDKNRLNGIAKNSLINEIIKETGANEVDENIRSTINEEFAGEKSSTDDETIFNNEDELNKAIIDTEDKNSNNKNQNGKKEKKKKRFFFF